MSSRIEQIIEEIEEYVESCKYQPLSTTKIVVNKEELEELLRELRLKTPDEIKRYQKIISNKDAILADAQAKSDAIIAETKAQVQEMVKESEVMQQAYAQANEVVELASKQAQEILDSATIEANNMKTAAMQYTDDILANVQSILSTGMNSFEAAQETMMTSLNSSLNVVVESRKELGGQDVSEESYNEEGEDDMPSHIKSAITNVCLTIPVIDGKLAMGQWQGIYLWEHRNNPGARKIRVTLWS